MVRITGFKTHGAFSLALISREGLKPLDRCEVPDIIDWGRYRRHVRLTSTTNQRREIELTLNGDVGTQTATIPPPTSLSSPPTLTSQVTA